MADTGTGTMTVNLPANAVVKQVLAYWEGELYQDGSEVMLINGLSVTGTQIGGNVPAQGISRSFRADITSLGLVGPGTNTLQFTATLCCGGTNYFSDHMDGAGVYVIYDSGTATGYGGNAVVIGATVGTTTTQVGSTGALPTTGGDLAPAPVNYSHPLNLVDIYNIKEETVGTGGVTKSTASATSIGFTVSGFKFAADAINSAATAQCDTSGNAKVSGSSQFTNLTIGGFSQAVSFQPNTVLLNLLGLLKVVVNEQTSSTAGANGTMTVNALHVTSSATLLAKATSVVIGSTTASINCAGAVSPGYIQIVDGKDYMTPFLQPTDPASFGATVPQTFTFASSTAARTGRLDFFVGFSDNSNNELVISVDGVPTMTLDGAIHSAQGDLFDDLTVYVPIPAGATSVTVQFTKGDNLVWVLAGLYLQSQTSGNLFSGEATVAHLDAKRFVSVTVADTGPLPATGGSLDATVSTLSLSQGVVATGITGDAHTTGAGSNSDSTASVDNLNLTALGITASATVVESEAHASCNASKMASATGSSTLTNLVVNGKATSVSPTLTIPLATGYLIIDEQIPDANSGGNIAGITVNALHLNVPVTSIPGDQGLNFVNLILASSHADIVCQ